MRWQQHAPLVQGKTNRYICPISGLRFYAIPDLLSFGTGKPRVLAVPGVTSLLSDDADPEEKQRLAEWRERQIEEGKDPDAGAKRGTAAHEILERHIRGSTFLRDAGPLADGSPEAFASGMEKHLDCYDDFLWSERPLRSGWGHVWSSPDEDGECLARVWSLTWGMAGTPDLIAREGKIVSLDDFKTSTRPYFRPVPGQKIPPFQIYSYKKYKKTVRQLCAYRLCIKETLNLSIDRIRIIVGLPEEKKSQLFTIDKQEMEAETENLKQAAMRFWRRQAQRTAAQQEAADAPAELQLAAA